MNPKTTDTNKRNWLIPLTLIGANVILILWEWSALPEVLPAHYDLEGHASGTMPRSILLLYPLLSLVVCLITHGIAHIKHKLQKGLIILTCGCSLTLLSSTLVTLSSGKMPIFMLAEPIILLVALIAAILSFRKAYKSIDSK